MPIIKGEKYACTSCIKGHRVSGCTHSDRELHHINPKGRPVKQCEHCRGARKSKSHHARCECGDKKDKDKHKDKGDSKGEKLGDVGAELASNSTTVSEKTCCCHDGAKCICGLKKDALVHKLDGTSKLVQLTKAKPRLTSAHSESTLTVFANGHHKPCHRLNNAAHTSGAPYKIPRPHTHPGMPAHTSEGLESIYGKYHEVSQRSLDNLGASASSFYGPFSNAQRSMDNLPSMNLSASLDLGGLKFDPSTFLFNPSSDPVPASSEQSSPAKSPGDAYLPTQWPWLNTTLAPQGAFGGVEDYSTSPTADFLSNSDNDWIIPSAGLNPLWSAGDLPLDPDKLTDDVTQPISHSGESSRVSAPGLTASSSGAQSEVGEPALFSEPDMKPQPSTDGQILWEDSIQFRDTSSYRLSSGSLLNDHGLPPTSMPQAKSRHSFDLNLLKRSNETHLFSQQAGINVDNVTFQPTTNDLTPPHKALGISPNFPSATGPTDSNTDYSTIVDSARAITIPNTFEEDGNSGSPWPPMFGMSNTGADDLSAYAWLN